MNEGDKNANILCFWSIGCLVLTFVLRPLTTFLNVMSASNSNSALHYLSMFCTALASVSSIASIILMIVARVQYPQNKFAKVLMWVYIIGFIVIFVLVALAVLLAVSACAALASSCPD